MIRCGASSGSDQRLDLDKATAFYRAIGLTETYFECDLAYPSATAILGFDDPRPFQIRIVKRPGSNFGMVGLFKLADGRTNEAIPAAVGPARIPGFDDKIISMHARGMSTREITGHLRDLYRLWKQWLRALTGRRTGFEVHNS